MSELPTHARGDGLGFRSHHSEQPRQFVLIFLSVPDKMFFKAKDFMLTAAFTSRSRTVEQLPQVHSRSFSCNSLLIDPQFEQVFDDGAKRPIRRMFLPYQSALYSNIETKVDQLASLIACAKLWFLTIFFTAKVSIAIVWFSRINCVETLCKKSLRLFTTSSCSLASFFFSTLALMF